MKCLEYQKHIVKDMQLSTPIKFIFAGLIMVLLFGVYAKSYASPRSRPGQIYWVSTRDVRLIGVRHGRRFNGQAYNTILSDRAQALVIAPGQHSAHVAIQEAPLYVKATSQGSEGAFYRYPCRIWRGGTYTVSTRQTIGYSLAESAALKSDRTCTFVQAPPPRAQLPKSTSIHTTSLHSSWLTPVASKSLDFQKLMLVQAEERTDCLIKTIDRICIPCIKAPLSNLSCPKPHAVLIFPHKKPTTLDENQRNEVEDEKSVSVSPDTSANEVVLYQARFENDRLVIHVVNGTILVKPPTGSQIAVTKNYRFTYPAENGNSLTQGIDPDWKEVGQLVNPNLWSSLSLEIQNLKNALPANTLPPS